MNFASFILLLQRLFPRFSARFFPLASSEITPATFSAIHSLSVFRTFWKNVHRSSWLKSLNHLEKKKDVLRETVEDSSMNPLKK